MAWHPPTKYFPRHYTGSTVRDGTLYHYGKGVWFPKIVAQGVLDPACTVMLPGERPVLWLSTHPVWEPTVNIGSAKPPGRRGLAPTATFAETLEGVHGLVRFALAPEVVRYDFATICTLAGITPPVRRGLLRTGRRQGAQPSDWYGTLDPVPRSQWAWVEVFQVDHWERVSPDQVARHIAAQTQGMIEITLRAMRAIDQAGWEALDLARQHRSGHWALPQGRLDWADGLPLSFVDLEGGGMLCLWEKDGRLRIATDQDIDPTEPRPEVRRTS
jgi:hypothetical protein